MAKSETNWLMWAAIAGVAWWMWKKQPPAAALQQAGGATTQGGPTSALSWAWQSPFVVVTSPLAAVIDVAGPGGQAYRSQGAVTRFEFNPSGIGSYTARSRDAAGRVLSQITIPLA